VSGHSPVSGSSVSDLRLVHPTRRRTRRRSRRFRRVRIAPRGGPGLNQSHKPPVCYEGSRLRSVSPRCVTRALHRRRSRRRLSLVSGKQAPFALRFPCLACVRSWGPDVGGRAPRQVNEIRKVQSAYSKNLSLYFALTFPSCQCSPARRLACTSPRVCSVRSAFPNTGVTGRAVFRYGA
jgi:hypothetical protein